MRKVIFALIFAMSISQVIAQTSVTTDPVGFTTTTCLADSDTYLTVPFTRPPAFIGTVQSAAGNTLTINGAPGWVANQFVYVAGTQPKRFYLIVGNGGSTNPKEGHLFPVTGNGTDTLIVDTSSEDVSGIAANTQVVVIPYWTPATIFPSTDVNVSFTPTASTSAYQTQLLIPSLTATGINLPYSPTYFFSNNVDGTSSNVGWRQVGDNVTDHGDDALSPDGYFVVRNQNGAPTRSLSLAGSVLLKKLSVPLLSGATLQQDNAVGMIRPVDVSLNATGLSPADNSFTEQDQLFLFNNAVPGFNKLPNATYTFDEGWRLSGDPTGNHGLDIIPAGSAMLVRKAAAGTQRIDYWTNSATYVANTVLVPLEVVSRKTHGAAGNFDINLPLVGAVGIESRSGGTNGDYKLLFTFADPLTSVGGATVANGSLSGSVAIDADPHFCVVNITGATTGRVVTVTLTNVVDSAGKSSASIAVPMGVLVGDVNQSKRVDGNDVSAVQAQTRRPVNNGNFRFDVNNTGTIDGNDVSLTQSKTRTSLP